MTVHSSCLIGFQLTNQATKTLLEIEGEILLVFNVISRFVEPVRLLPASVKAHRSFVFQQLISTTSSAGWPASKTLLLGVTNCRDQQDEADF